MSNTCWFCNKNPSSIDKSIVIPFYRETDKKFLGSTTFLNTTHTKYEIHYVKDRVTIPRCESCASLHLTEPAKAEAMKKKWQVIGTIAAIVFSLGIAVILFRAVKEDILPVFFVSICCLMPGVLTVSYIALFWGGTTFWQSKGTRPESEWSEYPEVLRLKKLGWVHGEEPPSHN